MSKVTISSMLALLLGFAMIVWGGMLPLHQNNVLEQTTGEFILSTLLTTGGILIVVMAFFGLSRSPRHKGVE